MNNWCICNNTGCIFVRASDFNIYDIDKLAFCCPICNEVKINFNILFNAVFEARERNKAIQRFRLNSYQLIRLSEIMAVEQNQLWDSKILGIPIELDNTVQKIEIDYK